MHALYFNGLTNGRTRRRERFAMRYLAKHGIIVEHVSIDWRSTESFEDLLERLTKLTKQKLREHGELTLIGASAGGSLALNVFGRVASNKLRVVTLCSRLHLATLPKWDWRTLKRMAYISTPKASQKFYDSVTYCTKKTISKLTKADKQYIIIVQQLMDAVVPRATMSINGVQIYKVFAIGHGWGIAEATRKLPDIFSQLMSK